ncbi:MAG: GNAT family N-acetyltransferase [Puniceicoccaceae bacterium]
MNIRRSKALDRDQVYNVHHQAFAAAYGGAHGVRNAQLAVDLLEDPTAMPVLSLVAEEDGKIIGNIIFTKVSIEGADREIEAQILAPLAVLPTHQKRGIGGKLIRAGNQMLKEAGTELVFVLGHPEYYPKHGYDRVAIREGFNAPYPIPEEYHEAWMVQQLNGNALETCSGKVICCEVLMDERHWSE